ncbi:hypothetical protein [Propionivibrio sp.]|uniref:hypothetical protein n=1 Tax=Propionivibrio sp. TaxID=2212460 RepID=UPI0039E2B6C0
MAEITSTEAGATGRYVNFGTQAALANLANTPSGCTVIAYIKAGAQGATNYIFGKCDSAGVGLRLALNSARQIAFSPYSVAGSINPSVVGTAAVPTTSWCHVQATATGNGSLLAAQIKIYIDAGAADTPSSAVDGSGSISSDTANPVYVLNRPGLGRGIIGDTAYVAVWNRVLSDSDRATVRANGPLSVASGLVFCFANDQDYSTNALTYADRSTRVTGSTPTNTALGTLATDATASGGTGAGAGSGSGGSATGETVSGDATADGGTGAGVGSGSGGDAVGSTITLSAAYERSSVNLTGSSVSGSGDSAIIAIKPKVQESEVVSSETRWLEPSVDVVGVNGLRPTFRFLDYKSGAGGMHAYPWTASRRPMYSYDDGATWNYFDTAVTLDSANQWVQFRHSAAFTQNKVRISRSRQASVHLIGDWIAARAAAYPDFFVPAPSALAYTPSSAVADYAAQAFIADEFSAQTDSLGAAVPITPFYAAQINDTSLTPLSGGAKRVAVFTSAVHAGEDYANYVLQAVLDYLCGASEAAIALRSEWRILIYLCINAPGRAGGGWRGSWTQGTSGADDANRHFSESGSGLEIVNKPKVSFTTDRAGIVPDWTIDFHGTFANTWSVYVDSGDAVQELFRTTLQSLSGQTIVNEGVSVGGNLNLYFKSLGARLGLTHECGDLAPMSDAAIVTQGSGIVRTLYSLLQSGVFGAVASGGTGIGVGSGSGGDATVMGDGSVTASGGVGTGHGSGFGGGADGQISGTASGGAGTGSGSGSGGDAAGAAGGSATASGGTGTGHGSGSGGAAAGQINGVASGGMGTGYGSGSGGDAIGGTADAVASGGTGTGHGSGSGGSAFGSGNQQFVRPPRSRLVVVPFENRRVRIQ